jgi:hypothetical protein
MGDAAPGLSADFAAMTDPEPPEAVPVPPPDDPWLVRRGHGDPRSPPNLGSEREPELVRQWGELIRRGQAGPGRPP